MQRVLIANRGEIAVRIARGCRAVGLTPLAVCSEVDQAAAHVLACDAVTTLGPAAPRESYLAIDRVLDAARAMRADAVHPGYGFLAENAAFAQAVIDAGLTWVGPSPQAIATMGDKVAARVTAERVGVPLVPGITLGDEPLERVRPSIAALGYPVLVKAAAGGGGKGMRTVATDAELPDAIAAARREALAAFGDGRVYVEKLLVRPRHVEVQVLGDTAGTLVHLGERECSIQRRHQKIVEETPCPILDGTTRRAMTEAALAAARAVDYTSAGTVEFLLADDGRFYFLEMNTRLQVEHSVTEWVTGVDLVAAQLRIAAGERLGFDQTDVRPRGHAIEVRLCAEDPAMGFVPSAGPILAWRAPSGPGVRVDTGFGAGSTVPVEYDSLLAKIAVWGPDRAAAIATLQQALVETAVVGPTTNLSYLRTVIDHPAYRAGATHTGFVPEHLTGWTSPQDDLPIAALAAGLAARAPSAETAATDAPAMTPWDTLGAWRLGGA